MFHVQISEAECLQAGATLVFRFRHFLCPSFCLILLPLSIPLLSLPISRWLSFLFSLTDPLITLIGFSSVVGRLVISALLAPAVRLAVNFISSTVNYKYMTALHITVYIYIHTLDI